MFLMVPDVEKTLKIHRKHIAEKNKICLEHRVCPRCFNQHSRKTTKGEQALHCLDCYEKIKPMMDASIKRFKEAQQREIEQAPLWNGANI